MEADVELQQVEAGVELQQMEPKQKRPHRGVQQAQADGEVKQVDQKQKGQHRGKERKGKAVNEQIDEIIAGVIEDLAANTRKINKSLPISYLYDSINER